MAETIRFYRRNLPHWLVAGHSYFVTLRLKGTLPVAAVDDLRREREELLRGHGGEATMTSMVRRQFVKVEAILDTCQYGHRWLEDPVVARVVLDGLNWLQTTAGWHIQAAVVMPNHVHALMRNEQGRNEALTDGLARFKRYTAREANRILKREGAFWMREGFDHWCRNTAKLEGAEQYIRTNPVRAGLVTRPEDWPWRM